MAEYDKYLFAFDSFSGDVIRFDEDFRREVYNRLLAFLGITEAEIPDTVEDYDFEIPDGMDIIDAESALSALGAQWNENRGWLDDTNTDGTGYEIQAILEGLKYDLKHYTDGSADVYYIDKTDAPKSNKLTREKGPKIFLIADRCFTDHESDGESRQYSIFDGRDEITDYFRHYFEYGLGNEITDAVEKVSGESYTAVLSKLESFLNDPTKDITGIQGEKWIFGSLSLEICFCDVFPGIIDGLYDSLAEYFEDYVFAEESGDENWMEDFDPDDEMLFVYNSLKPNARKPLSEYRMQQVFLMLDQYFS